SEVYMYCPSGYRDCLQKVEGPFWHKAIDVPMNYRNGQNWWMRIPNGNSGYPIDDNDRFTLLYFNEKPSRTWSRQIFEYSFIEGYSSQQMIYAMRGGDKMSFTLEMDLNQNPQSNYTWSLDMHASNPFTMEDVTKYVNNGTFEYVVPAYISQITEIWIRFSWRYTRNPWFNSNSGPIAGQRPLLSNQDSNNQIQPTPAPIANDNKNKMNVNYNGTRSAGATSRYQTFVPTRASMYQTFMPTETWRPGRPSGWPEPRPFPPRVKVTAKGRAFFYDTVSSLSSCQIPMSEKGCRLIDSSHLYPFAESGYILITPYQSSVDPTNPRQVYNKYYGYTSVFRLVPRVVLFVVIYSLLSLGMLMGVSVFVMLVWFDLVPFEGGCCYGGSRWRLKVDKRRKKRGYGRGKVVVDDDDEDVEVGGGELTEQRMPRVWRSDDEEDGDEEDEVDAERKPFLSREEEL
ncbi:hypothetical protein HDU76_009915, partial [Blyttiomyces sp. JEL0837]